jgi:hypothetical protein
MRKIVDLTGRSDRREGKTKGALGKCPVFFRAGILAGFLAAAASQIARSFPNQANRKRQNKLQGRS